jgi:hypothetical protein
MMRFSARVAFGLVLTLSASSFAMASQIVPGATSTRENQPNRSFSRITFGGTRLGAPLPGPVSRPSGPLDRMLGPASGARLPEITVAPEPHRTTAPCVMRVVPVDPNHKSSMPVVGVDKRADPKGVITIPTCQPLK